MVSPCTKVMITNSYWQNNFCFCYGSGIGATKVEKKFFQCHLNSIEGLNSDA